MDTIQSEWIKETRIGGNVPTYETNYFYELEEYITKVCAKFDLTSKYNVGPLIGGVPPANDNSKIVNSFINSISYHDSMGGILISTRNAEINCRNIDKLLAESFFESDIVADVCSKINDKYVLESPNQVYDKVIFLPGSNLYHTVDWDKINEALVDHPTAMIKLHPVVTESSADYVRRKWSNRVIDQNVSGLQLLKNASLIWTSFNSEFGLIATMLKKPFVTINKWGDAFSMIYSPIYRNFKYKDVEYNYEIIRKVICSKKSGYVFPWQVDWKERVNSYFDSIHEFKTGMEYPYV